MIAAPFPAAGFPFSTSDPYSLFLRLHHHFLFIDLIPGAARILGFGHQQKVLFHVADAKSAFPVAQKSALADSFYPF